MERAALAVVREPAVEIVVPVHNEERDLERGVRRLRAYLDACFPFHATVTVADNASTDATQAIGERLAGSVRGVNFMRLSDRRRGRGVAAAWLLSRADVVACADLRLSKSLDVILPLVALIVGNQSDVAIGSCVAHGTHSLSRGYRALARVALGAWSRDRRCAFFAIRTPVAQRLIPRVEDRSWFFEVELVYVALLQGLRVQDIPVSWTDARPLKVMSADGA